MKFNSYMESLIKENAISLETPIRLDPSLAAVLKPGVVRMDNGTFVLKALEINNASISDADFRDETGYEAFANHVHVEDYLRHESIPIVTLLNQSIAFAKGICDLLQRSFPKIPFEIIVATSGHSSAVRFHKRRAGQTWLSEDLEDYKEEAILIL